MASRKSTKSTKSIRNAAAPKIQWKQAAVTAGTTIAGLALIAGGVYAYQKYSTPHGN